MRSTALLALKGPEERFGRSHIRGIRRNGAELDGRSDGDIRYVAPRESRGVVYTEADSEDETLYRAMITDPNPNPLRRTCDRIAARCRDDARRYTANAQRFPDDHRSASWWRQQARHQTLRALYWACRWWKR